jgi:hypothetical protein
VEDAAARRELQRVDPGGERRRAGLQDLHRARNLSRGRSGPAS